MVKKKQSEKQTKAEQKKIANVFNQKLLQAITDFTKETGLVVLNIRLNPKVDPIGETGMANVNYSLQIDYGGLE